jgi:hypothetical protein
VQPVLVVDLCDEAIDATAGIADVGEGPAVDLLRLQGLHEAFGLGVVEGIAGPAHAYGDVVFGKSLAIGDGGVLHAAIGVMDQAAGLRLSSFEGCVQRGNGERGIERVLQSPADGFAREGVENDGKIDEGSGEMHIGDVGDQI